MGKLGQSGQRERERETRRGAGGRDGTQLLTRAILCVLSATYIVCTCVCVCVCNSVPRRSQELKATPAKSLLHLNDIIMHAFGTRLSGLGLWLRLLIQHQHQLQLRLQLQFQLRLDHLRVCLSSLCLLSAPYFLLLSLSPSLCVAIPQVGSTTQPTEPLVQICIIEIKMDF